MFELQVDIHFLGYGGTLLSLLEAVIYEDSEGTSMTNGCARAPL